MDNGYVVALGSVLYQGGSGKLNPASTTEPSHMAVYQSTDDGTHWTRIALDTAGGEVQTLAIQASNTNIMYAGGGVYASGSTWPTYSRIYKSTNAGSTWNQIGSSTFGKQYESITKIVIDPFNVNVLAATTNNGVYTSTDAGSSWTVPAGYMYAYTLLCNPDSSGIYYAGAASGVWRSTDRGKNWNNFSNGLGNVRATCLAYDRTNRRLYAGTEGSGVYRLNLSGSAAVRDRAEGLPETFVMRQNYPNPFNPTTTIEIGVPVQTLCRLTIFDALGREITSLANEVLSAGYHRFRFDASGLSSGVYICRFSSGTTMLAQRMVLLK